MTDAELLAEIEATPPARRPAAKRERSMTDAELLAEIEATPARPPAKRLVKLLASHAVAGQQAPFNPDAYLAQSGPPAREFDPNAYLATPDPARPSNAGQASGTMRAPGVGSIIVEVDGVKMEVPADATVDEIDSISRAPRQPTAKSESVARGAFQGLSAGFGDEAAAALAAMIPFTDREAARGGTIGERYKNARDFYRARNTAAESANPGLYTTGQVVGAVAPALTGVGAATTGGRALSQAVGQGAAQGVGYSDKGSISGLAEDAALGAGLGVAGHGAGKLLRRVSSSITNRAGQMASLARARAGTQAAQETADQLASASGTLGAEVQKGSRYVENLMRLEGSMTPAQKALYAQLEQSGVVPNLQRAVAQGTLERLPDQAATIAARQAELQALQAAAPAAVQGRTAALLTPQVRQDLRSLAKSYAEPVLASYLGYKAADALGADPESKAGAAAAAGLIFGRTRAGKALRTRIDRPAHQLAIAEKMRNGANSRFVDALREVLQRGAPAVATDKLTDE